jgi:hypothetical protein
MTHDQIEDLAEFYALGTLDDDERAAIAAHLRECSSCARAIGARERDVALIASNELQQKAPPELGARIERVLRGGAKRPIRRVVHPAWTLAAGVAAAFFIGILPSIYLWNENRMLRGTMLAQSAAMDRLVTASHRTAGFRPMQPSPPAEVIYAPDGTWYLVVVRDASKTLAVVWMHDGSYTMLGRAVPRGNLALLYLSKSHPMDRLALMDGDRIVAEATLSWQRTLPNRRGARSG